ncbi:MAG: cell division protein FtsA, partial [Candidatus Nucleicultricaceae bacterium]
TSIAIFYEGKLHHIDHINVGGSHVTNDLARGLSTPLNHAERVKILYGSAMVSPLSSAEERTGIRVPQIGEDDVNKGVQVNKSELVRIIRPRIEETFELVREKLKTIPDLSKISKRLVLTGGASQLTGVRELASMILDKHTRLAKPIHVQGIDERVRTASFATCAGLISLAKKEQKIAYGSQKKPKNDNISFLGRIGSWLKDNL